MDHEGENRFPEVVAFTKNIKRKQTDEKSKGDTQHPGCPKQQPFNWSIHSGHLLEKCLFIRLISRVNSSLLIFLAK
jgi:hypothetical protein